VGDDLEAEIAPTAASRAPIDRLIAVVDGVGGIYFSLTALFARFARGACAGAAYRPVRLAPSARRWSLARLAYAAGRFAPAGRARIDNGRHQPHRRQGGAETAQGRRPLGRPVRRRPSRS